MAKVLLLGLEKVMTDQLARVLLEQDHEVSAEAAPGRVPGYLEADVVFSSHEALFALKTARPGQPFIVVTRLPEVNDWLDALEAGATDYCAAPFEHRQVRWLMDNALSCAHRAAA